MYAPFIKLSAKRIQNLTVFVCDGKAMYENRTKRFQSIDGSEKNRS